MLLDVVVNPFGASVADLVGTAVRLEREGLPAADGQRREISGIWVTDHFSGDVVGAPWSRDPFVCLGAAAAVTSRVRLGVLVANMMNRHPAQLASAVDSLCSLAPGRVVVGIGSGAAPGSRFAVEHEAIGTALLDAGGRRDRLRDTIVALRSIWAGVDTVVAPGVGYSRLASVIQGSDDLRVVVGASAWPTIELAARHADGVNIRVTTALPEQLRRLQAIDLPAEFEVSVLDDLSLRSDVSAELADAARPEQWVGVQRRIVTIAADDPMLRPS